MISGPYYTSVIGRLCCAILKKRCGKVSHAVLLLHASAPVDKYNIVQAAIRKAGFVELNHPAYSPDIEPCDCYLLSNLKKFLCGKNFSCDDKTIDTVEGCLNNLDSEFFVKA